MSVLTAGPFVFGTRANKADKGLPGYHLEACFVRSPLTLEIRGRELINFPKYVSDTEKEKCFRVLTIFPRDENMFSDIYVGDPPSYPLLSAL